MDVNRQLGRSEVAWVVHDTACQLVRDFRCVHSIGQVLRFSYRPSGLRCKSGPVCWQRLGATRLSVRPRSACVALSSEQFQLSVAELNSKEEQPLLAQVAEALNSVHF